MSDACAMREMLILEVERIVIHRFSNAKNDAQTRAQMATMASQILGDLYRQGPPSFNEIHSSLSRRVET